jgi:2-phosphosulfolactate phosphatase
MVHTVRSGMKAELYFTPAGLTNNDLYGKTVVVIDVLRACTVICTAFAAGCREVIPVNSIGDGSTLLGNLDRDVVLLAGERDGYRVEGFDLGNSPLEFTKDVVRNKTIILASTNGSKAMVLGSSGESMLAASFVNVSAIVDKVASLDDDIAVVCSGKESRFSLEDVVCGGMIIAALGSRSEIANDAAMVAKTLYEAHKDDIASALRTCDHGRYLRSIGFADDIDYAAGIDTIGVLPQWENGRFLVGEAL